jgi:hypothetical protein
LDTFAAQMNNLTRFDGVILALVFMIAGLGISGCNNDNSAGQSGSDTPEAGGAQRQIPVFNRDSAYAFIEAQLAFGPRNPGSSGIKACRDWMVSKMESYGAEVIRQKFKAKIHDGNVFPSENLIGQFNPDNRNRIILAAHYDTRAIAEEDPNPERRNEPIPGADDGGRGVGVLLEIARLIHEHQIDLGIDIILFDVEDQGTRNAEEDPENSSWCIGSQYWSKNLHKTNYKPRFGILLDMVGSQNAFFNKENVTGHYAHYREVHVLYSKVWNLAAAMGKGRYFQNRTIAGIIDDHYFVNKIAGIPMIDIINKAPGEEQSFGAHWHTHDDDLAVIDKTTLAAVGQVVTAVVYRAAGGNF